MKRLSIVIAYFAVVLFVACGEKRAAVKQPRVEIRKLTGSTVEFVPTPNQLPYCLVFTVSKTGTIRQLTMTRDNKSVRCDPGQPIGGVSYRIPLDEGSVRVRVFFSNQRLNAGSVAQQVLEDRDKPTWNATDLRLPGQVNIEVLDFTPEPDTAPTVGAVVSSDNKAPDNVPSAESDAGSPSMAH